MMRIPKSLALLTPPARAKHPRVRLEAVVAASFFNDARAAAVALAVIAGSLAYVFRTAEVGESCAGGVECAGGGASKTLRAMEMATFTSGTEEDMNSVWPMA